MGSEIYKEKWKLAKTAKKEEKFRQNTKENVCNIRKRFYGVNKRKHYNRGSWDYWQMKRDYPGRQKYCQPGRGRRKFCTKKYFKRSWRRNSEMTWSSFKNVKLFMSIIFVVDNRRNILNFITREDQRRKQMSQSDYLLVRKEYFKYVQDVKVSVIII